MFLNSVSRHHLDLNLVCALDDNREVSVKTCDACRKCQNINFRKVIRMYSSLPAASELQESSHNFFFVDGGRLTDYLLAC